MGRDIVEFFYCLRCSAFAYSAVGLVLLAAAAIVLTVSKPYFLMYHLYP